MCFKVVLIKEKGHGLQSRIKKEMTGHGFRFVGISDHELFKMNC